MQYSFGTYPFDPARYELLYAGQPVALRPKACELLGYLLAHRDRVVSKEELLAQVWSGQYVGDAVLHDHLAAAMGGQGQGESGLAQLRQGLAAETRSASNHPPADARSRTCY